MEKVLKILINLIPNKKKRIQLRDKMRIKKRRKEADKVLTVENQKKLKDIENNFPKLNSIKTTVEKLKDGYSIARFGDGEFDICLGKNLNNYQKYDIELSKKLKNILKNKCKNEKCLIGIPPFKDKYVKINEKLPRFWELYWLEKYEEIRSLWNEKNIYENSFISRSNCFDHVSLNEIKEVWQDKNIVFVYGKNGRFYNDLRLFDNIKNKIEIFIKPIDAYDNYEEILKECKKMKKDMLFLISGGPTATVLAWDLSLVGYQAIDIGHIVNSYQEFLGEIKCPEEISSINL